VIDGNKRRIVQDWEIDEAVKEDFVILTIGRDKAEQV
jgi:hypothetical protein